VILLLFWLLILITGVDSTYRNEALRPSFVTIWTGSPAVTAQGYGPWVNLNS